MTIYLIKKKKNRIYKSEDIVPLLLENEGLSGLTFTHGASGEPLLTEVDAAGLSDNFSGTGVKNGRAISISDTKNFWAAVISESSDVGIGLDIEENTRNVRENVVKKLHPLERQYLSGLAPGSSEWTAEFLNVWTRKEAYSKFCAAGLALGFGKFSVVDRALEYGEIISCPGRPQALVTELSLPFGLCGALCTALTKASEETSLLGTTPEANPSQLQAAPEADPSQPQAAPEADSSQLQAASEADPSQLQAAPKADPSAFPRIQLFSYDGLPPVSALSAGASLLSVRNASTAELSAKLQKKGYTKEEADSAASQLAARGYLDDAAYASRQAVLAAQSGKSTGLIRRELSAKGLSAADIQQALENLEAEDAESELDRALAVALRTLPLPQEGEEKPDEKQLAKVARRLASRGYGPGIIYEILDKYR